MARQLFRVTVCISAADWQLNSESFPRMFFSCHLKVSKNLFSVIFLKIKQRQGLIRKGLKLFSERESKTCVDFAYY